MAEQLLVEAEAVSKVYGHLRAVDDVSLTVAAGEVVGLLGANGAGKTTLIRLLLGLELPTSGSVLVLGTPPSRRSRERLGYVAQGLGLYPDLSVRENLEFTTAAFGVPPPTLPDALAAVADLPVRSIPLGLRRQLAFLCALGHRPDLLVLDEPTSGVDPLARARLWDTIHEQAERGAGVLVTTHYMQEAEQCTRLEILSAGRRTAAGTHESLTAGSQAVQVDADRWEQAFAALSADGLPVTLVGRSVRVAVEELPPVQDALTRHGVRATLTTVPSTLEEVMVRLENT